MAYIDSTGFGFYDGGEKCDEAVIGAVSAGVLVQTRHLAPDVFAILKENVDPGMEAGHDQRRRNPFSRHVGDDQVDTCHPRTR